MLMKKNALISIAMVLALAACGGGSDGDSNPPATNPPADGGNPPGGDNPPANVDDSLMEGHMVLVNNQVLFNGTGVALEDFSTTGAYGFAKGTTFPLQSFGLRLMPVDMTTETGQSKRARVALELMDSAEGGQQAVQMMIDEVDIAIDAAGVWTVTVPSTATLYAYARDAAGATANLAVTNLPADLIRLASIDGDPSSNGFTIDVDRAFQQVVAGAPAEDQAVFNSVIGFTGDFNLRSTVSNVEIHSQTGGTVLTGASITVTGSNQPAVTGAGVQGILQVE